MDNRHIDEFNPADYYGTSGQRTARGIARPSGQTGNRVRSGEMPGGAAPVRKRPPSAGENHPEYRRPGNAGSSGRGNGSAGNGKKRKKTKKRRAKPLFYIVIAILLVLIAAVVFLLLKAGTPSDGTEQKEESPGGLTALFATASPSPSPTPEPTPEPTPTPKFDTPHAVSGTQPENWGYVSELEVNGSRVDSYQRSDRILFGTGEEYTQVDGIVTFRGNNFRDESSFGTASVVNRDLLKLWTVETGEIMRGTSSDYKNVWTGSLWTGQPLVVRWPESTKKIMRTMYDSAKTDPDLVEVIYATGGGDIYFLNLKTGEPTRDTLKLNMPFKGAGALDPRGYPILYLGSGDMYDDYPDMQTRAMAVSLIDGSVLYEFGKAYDPFALRGWHAYDSSALVSAETDTLIYPGENGIIYTVKMNTSYDETAGTLSMNPGEVVKYRYNTNRSSTGSKEGTDMFWLGFESSATIWGEYLYLASNDGFVHCINLNTMEPVWIQDVGDDANGSLVLEEDEANRTAYLYAGPTLHFTQNAEATGTVPMFKIDAVTGEILWRYDKKVHTNSHARGGIQATAILGRGKISDLVIIPFERTYSDGDPDNDALGYTVALNRKTGEVVWEKKTNYAWSSPIAIYDEEGNAYIVQPDSHGNIYLFDGQTGERCFILESGGKNFEATGVAYGNMIVIGNKDHKIFGIQIS